MRPDLGYVKDVPLELFCLLGTHQLNVDIPNWIFASLNGLKHVLDHVVWILSGNPGSFLTGEILDALLRFDVDFGVFERAILNVR